MSSKLQGLEKCMLSDAVTSLGEKTPHQFVTTLFQALTLLLVTS
jgi:hypothetical protein